MRIGAFDRLVFSLFHRNRWIFLRPRRRFHQVMAAAGREAGGGGIDSLDLLVATIAAPEGAELLTRLNGDPQAIEVAARQARVARNPSPGLTDDAKVVVEAVSHRALLDRAGPDVQALLVGLALADCPARRVLSRHGIDASRLIGLVGGPPRR